MTCLYFAQLERQENILGRLDNSHLALQSWLEGFHSLQGHLVQLLMFLNQAKQEFHSHSVHSYCPRSMSQSMVISEVISFATVFLDSTECTESESVSEDHTNKIKVVFCSFPFCYGLNIPLAPFRLINPLVHFYSFHVLISTNLYLAVKHCRIQVSENTFVYLFELHDYYCIHYLMSTYIHDTSFCLTHVRYNIIM